MPRPHYSYDLMTHWTHLDSINIIIIVTVSICKLKNILYIFVVTNFFFLYIYIFSQNFGRVSFIFFRYQVIDSIISQPVTSITIFVPSFGHQKTQAYFNISILFSIEHYNKTNKFLTCIVSLYIYNQP